MKLWRIATETRHYSADDLSGTGAAKSPGRWNADGEPVIYCAPSVAVAVLETAAHIDDGGLPLNRYLVAIEVPKAVWAARAQATERELPAGWDAIPAGMMSVTFGSEWLRSPRSAVLLVPSVIVPEERIALINPRHRDASALRARKVRRFDYNRLFRVHRG